MCGAERPCLPGLAYSWSRDHLLGWGRLCLPVLGLTGLPRGPGHGVGKQLGLCDTNTFTPTTALLSWDSSEVHSRDMCCDRDNFPTPKFQSGALLTNESIKNAQSHWAEHQGL